MQIFPFRLIIIFSILVIFSFSTRIFSAFNRSISCARIDALGGSFIALADDPYATFMNPSGLGKMYRPEISFSYSNPYNTKNLEHLTLLGAYPFAILSIGFGFSRFGDRDIYTEDIYCLGTGKSLFSQDFLIGAAIKLYHLSIKGLEYPENRTDDAKMTFDSGISYKIKNLWLGFSALTLIPVDIDLFQDGLTTAELKSHYGAGMDYRLTDSSNFLNRVDFLCDAEFDSDFNYLKYHTGMEAWFLRILAGRIGLNQGQFSMGFGINTEYVSFDVSLNNHEYLPDTYEFTIYLKF